MKSKKVQKVIITILLDILLLGVCILTFFYFHSFKPKELDMEPIIITRPTATPAPAATPATDIETEQSPTAEPVLTWEEKFADKFTSDGSVIQTDTSYISENTHITITKVETTIERDFKGQMVDYPVLYYLADIYITDIEQFSTAMPNDEYGTSGSTLKQVVSHNGVVGVNGDNYCGLGRNSGLVIRNGAYLRDNLLEGADILVLYYDGSMEVYLYEEIDMNQIIAKGAYQAWCFGPALLINGQPYRSPQQSDYIDQLNPRTAIGYYEPGHYCMVVVEGRDPSPSSGMSVGELSELFYQLGCQNAYNMDGGATSAMVFGGSYMNVRAGGGRHSTDTILILDPDYNKED